MKKFEVENKLKDNKLPEGWAKVKLDSLLIESKERNITNKKLLVFSIANVKGFVLQDEYFSHNIHSEKTTNYKIFRENYFGYNPARINVGSIALSEKQREGLLSPMYVIFKTKSTLNPKYLKYFIQTSHFKNNVINNVAGSVRESLNYSSLEMFDFIYPISISEQNRIAEILETVDETIDKTDAIIEKYKRIKQGLMQDLLTRGIDENEQIRSEETHKFKDSPLGRIPEEWEVVELGKTVDIYDNLRIPLNNEERKEIKGKYPYCGANGIVDYINKYIFDGEYVLVAEDGGYFKRLETSAYLMKGKFWVNNHAHIISAKNNVAVNKFILYNLIFWDLSIYIDGTTREKLNQNRLALIKIFLPQFHEQRRIVSILSQIDETIEKEQNYKEKFKRIKQGLMEDLLTGKVRVNHLTKEGVESV